MSAPASAVKIFAIAAIALSAASCATAQKSTGLAQTTSTGAAQLNLKKGQYLSVTISEAKTSEEAVKARLNYYRTGYPLGAQYGLRQETSLSVVSAIISDYKPTGVLFFSYPDKQSADGLAANPDWEAVKATRPDIWNELKIFSAETTEDLAIKFDPEKSYTLVVAWKKDEDPDGYEKYLSGIEPAVARAGGRFIYKMYNPQLESNDASEPAPAQLTFVEWDDLDGFSRVQATEEYKASVPFFQSGVSKIEFYRMSVRQ
ncbi:MAG: hypothetical protein ABJF89_13335 [Parasphingorhabdus sp.]|uniref:hypothetical protein n=1 Tax=Parasphingorhabdus sp. TaxID=2709688 RepID=UPI0032647D98